MYGQVNKLPKTKLIKLKFLNIYRKQSTMCFFFFKNCGNQTYFKTLVSECNNRLGLS